MHTSYPIPCIKLSQAANVLRTLNDEREHQRRCVVSCRKKWCVWLCICWPNKYWNKINDHFIGSAQCSTPLLRRWKRLKANGVLHWKDGRPVNNTQRQAYLRVGWIWRHHIKCLPIFAVNNIFNKYKGALVGRRVLLAMSIRNEGLINWALCARWKSSGERIVTFNRECIEHDEVKICGYSGIELC